MRPEKTTLIGCLGMLLLLSGCASAGDPGALEGEGVSSDVAASADTSGDTNGADQDAEPSVDPVAGDVAVQEDGEPTTPDDVTLSPGDAGAGDATVTVDAVPAGDDVQEPPAIPCEGDNPAGCAQTGCPDGTVCKVGDACIPSACFCDDGGWTCTEDCGGGACVGGEEPPVDPSQCDTPNPASCSGVPCPVGLICDEAAGCAPSDCQCTELGIWNCTKDCVPGICVPKDQGPTPVDPAGCKQPSPVSCIVAGCLDGFVCDEDAPGCSPSSCTCEAGPDGPMWACTKDCLLGQCIPAIPTPPLPGFCPKPSPATCVETGCPGSMVCDLEEGCAPSECTCNTDSGAWECTEDCVPGVCIPKPPPEPEPPVECLEGEVSTPLGCLSCDDAYAHVLEKMPFVEGGADKCLEDSECVLTDGGTACAGACPISVNGDWEEIYLAKKQTLSDDFCTGYAEECGYMTPSCLPVEPQCIDGLCEAVPVTQ
ncbi:MAG: hypothetical protein VX938_04610 [Myxococcota bacterium]|nr:hypothetical protein [Myxococcota bacterium]